MSTTIIGLIHPNDISSFSIEKFQSKFNNVNNSFILFTPQQYTDSNYKNVKLMYYDSNKLPYFTTKYRNVNHYTLLMSKFIFLQQVSINNPFNTQYFLYLDDYNTMFDLQLLDKYKLKLFDDKLLLDSINPTIIGGSKLSIKNALNDCANAVNHNGNFVQLMIKNNPNNYYLYNDIKIQDFMIGRRLPVNYSTNYKLKMLFVATKEIQVESYSKLVNTAEFYGYNYEAIGRDKQWIGFHTKLLLFHDYILNNQHEYYLMVDASDVIMTASSHELLERFISSGKDIIVGSEWELCYPKGRHDREVILDYFETRKKSEFKFPNTGFIIGKRDKLLQYFSHTTGYLDDQGACIDVIYENKAQIDIDYDTEFVGNVPHYHYDTHPVFYEFQFDKKYNRYYNKTTKMMPCCFHFPGKEWRKMNECYYNTFLRKNDEPVYYFDDGSPKYNNENELLALVILFVFMLILVVTLVMFA